MASEGNTDGQGESFGLGRKLRVAASRRIVLGPEFETHVRQFLAE